MGKTSVFVIGVLLVLLGVLGQFYGYVRSAGGLIVGTLLLYLGFTYFRAAGQVPPDKEATDARDEDLIYVCAVCGLTLRVEIATNDKAPTHCRERMDLVRREGGLRALD